MAYRLVLWGFLLLVITGCKRDPISWETTWSAPMAKGRLTISDILPDSLRSVDPNGEVHLAYTYPLLQSTAGALVPLPDTTVGMGIKLSDIDLPQQHLFQGISLGKLCESGGIGGATVIANNGGTLVIPPIKTATSQKINVTIPGLDYANIQRGSIDVKLENNFPLDLTDLKYRVYSKSTNVEILRDSFSLVQAFSSVTHTLSLDGKMLKGDLVAELLGISTPGSGSTPVLIDTSQTSYVHIYLNSLRVSDARLILPQATLVDKWISTTLQIAPYRFEQVNVRSGTIRVHCYSSLPQGISCRYQNPGIRIKGQPLQLDFTIPATFRNGLAHRYIDINMEDASIDFTGQNHDTVNTLYHYLKARIDSSGQWVNLYASDSVRMDLEFRNMKVAFAQGYFGNDTINLGPGNISSPIFGKLQNTQLALAQTKFSFQVINGVNCPARFFLKSLKATNTATGKTKWLTGSILNSSWYIPAAAGQTASPMQLVLDETNSNIQDLIALLPDQVWYYGQLVMNAGQTKAANSAYDTALCQVDLSIDIPAKFIASNLVLSDTVDVNWHNLDYDTRLKKGVAYLFADNSFPIQAFITGVLLDGTGRVIDSLDVVPWYLAPGNGSNATTSRYEILFDEKRFVTWKRGNRFVWTARLKTDPSQGMITLTNRQGLAIQLTSSATIKP